MEADQALTFVPAVLHVEGPLLCLATIEDYRDGRLNGAWLDLRQPVERLLAVAHKIERRSGHVSPTIGIFDHQGLFPPPRDRATLKSLSQLAMDRSGG